MRYLYLLFLLFTSLLSLHSQIDTSFWFVAPRVPSAIGVSSVGLQISSYSQPATVLVRQPANLAGVNLTITLAANSTTVVDLTADQALITSTLPNAADNKGLYISSTNSVSVNYYIESGVSRENIGLKGRNGLSLDFYTPFPNNLYSLVADAANGNTAYDVIATEPGVTSLLVTPRGNLIGPRPKNVTFVVSLNQGQTFSCKESLITRNPIATVSRDFNGDGFLDLAVVDQRFNEVIIMLGNGTGTFTDFGIHKVGHLPNYIVATDVNNDGNVDLITTNFGADNVSVLIGNGAGGFAPATQFSTGGGGPFAVDARDINGDSNVDLVIVNRNSFQMTVLFGNGAGAFTHNGTYVTGNAPNDVKLFDFNGDSFLDVVVANNTSNSISVFLGAAAGTFATPATTVSATSAGPFRIAIGDFNSDGFEDVAVTQRGANNVRVLRSNGAGTFTSNVNYATGTNPEAIVTATVNNDGNLDLVVANAGSNNMSVLLGDAAGNFAAAANSAVGTNPRSIAFGDFNNDGINDFATANFNSNNYTVRIGNHTAAMTAAVNTVLGQAFYPATELAGSIVSADKKVSVTISGGLGANSGCSSFYADQITSSDKLGLHYVIHKSNTNNDRAFIFAPVNSTSLSVTSATTTNFLINSGETFTVNTAGNPLTYIQSDKPVYILNIAGNGCKLTGAQIAPAYCAGSYTAGFMRTGSDSLFLNIYVRNGAQTTFTMEVNAVPITIPAASFSIVPGTAGNLRGARIYYNTTAVPVGAYCVIKNSADLFGFSVQEGSNALGSNLTQHSQFDSETFVIANSTPQATICSNTTFTLNGIVGGGPNTGVWSTNGFGSFGLGPNTLTNNVYTPGLLDTVNKPINIVLNSTGICPNRTDTLKLFVLQGPIVGAGSNQLKCSNNATIELNGTVIGASSQGSWTAVPPANGTFTSTTALQTMYLPSNSDTALAVINLVLTSINNGICNAESSTVSITIQKAPIVIAAPSPTIVRCSNNATVNLNGYISSSIVSGVWSSDGTGVFVPNNISLTNNYLPSLSDIANPPIKLKLTTPPSALCKEVSDSVYVYFTDPSVVSAGVDLNSCKNNPVATLSAVVTGTAAGGVSWSGGTGTFFPDNTVLTPTYVASPTEVSNGFVILTVITTSNGICNSTSDQIRIDFRDKPTANFASNTVCLNQPTQYTDLSINTSGLGFLSSWDWNFGNGNGSNAVNPATTFTAPGTYSTTLIVGNSFNCYDTISRDVTVYPLPTVGFGYTRSCAGLTLSVCFTDSSSVIAPSTIPSTGYYYDFGGPGFSVSKDTCFVFPTEGFYSVTHLITTDHGCVASLTRTINITPKPKAKFIFFNQSGQSLQSLVTFADSSSNAIQWYWDFGDGNTSINQNPSNTYNENGTYTVTQTVTDQFGCTDTYTLIVRIANVVNDVIELIPNIITPNGDGSNDYWRLDFIDVFYPKAEINIYNRWGDLIYNSIGYSNAWDGTYRDKNSPLPVGVYFYTINLNDPNKPDIIKGTITLMK